MKSVKRYSQKREAILDKIRSATCHPTADWIYHELKGEYPDLSLGTVYRNLAAFKDEGIISSVGKVDGQERFDGKMQPHGHFICRQCRVVIDIGLSADLSGNLSDSKSDLIVHPESINQHKVERVDFTAYGVCAECLKAE